MATVQNENGTVEGANTYGTATYFREYHAARGRTFDQTDEQIDAAGVIATDYMDSRWSYIGVRIADGQNTEWPRWDAYDRDDRIVNGIPEPVKQAWAEYTAIQLTEGTLEPTPDRDASGARVVQRSERVGPISESVTLAAGGRYVRPIHPIPDGILKRRGLVAAGGQIIRG